MLNVDSIRYGSFAMSNCSMVQAHFVIHCMTVPGVGTRHAVFITVQGQQSAPSTATALDSVARAGSLSYSPPILEGMGALDQSGLLASPQSFHSTSGGVVMKLVGSGFGPAGSGTWVQFGDGGGNCGQQTSANQTMSSVEGAECAQVTHVNDTLLFFTTPEGQGSNVAVRVVAGSVTSESVLYYSYSPPTINRLTVLQSEEVAALLASRGSSSSTSAARRRLQTTELFVYATGSNFGPSPEVRVTDILDESVRRDVFPVDGGFATHSEVLIAVHVQEGSVRIIAGD